jgi:hypothetical protein
VRFLRNWDSMESHRTRAVEPHWEMMSARSSEMVPMSQVQTTAFIRTQSGEAGATASERAWHSRENLVSVRRKDSHHRA